MGVCDLIQIHLRSISNWMAILFKKNNMQTWHLEAYHCAVILIFIVDSGHYNLSWPEPVLFDFNLPLITNLQICLEFRASPTVCVTILTAMVSIKLLVLLQWPLHRPKVRLYFTQTSLILLPNFNDFQIKGRRSCLFSWSQTWTWDGIENLDPKACLRDA